VTKLPEREDGSLGRHHVECALAGPGTVGPPPVGAPPATYCEDADRDGGGPWDEREAEPSAAYPAYPNSSITELKFPSLNPSGLLQLVTRFCSVALVSTCGFSEPTTLPALS
jgi:hypothetical protein